MSSEAPSLESRSWRNAPWTRGIGGGYRCCNDYWYIVENYSHIWVHMSTNLQIIWYLNINSMVVSCFFDVIIPIDELIALEKSWKIMVSSKSLRGSSASPCKTQAVICDGWISRRTRLYARSPEGAEDFCQWSNIHHDSNNSPAIIWPSSWLIFVTHLVLIAIHFCHLRLSVPDNYSLRHGEFGWFEPTHLSVLAAFSVFVPSFVSCLWFLKTRHVPGSKLPLFPYNRGWSSTQ